MRMLASYCSAAGFTPRVTREAYQIDFNWDLEMVVRNNCLLVATKIPSMVDCRGDLDRVAILELRPLHYFYMCAAYRRQNLNKPYVREVIEYLKNGFGLYEDGTLKDADQ